MARWLVLLSSFLIAFDTGAAETLRHQDSTIYRDDKNGFEFAFPASHAFESVFGSGALKKIATGTIVFMTEVWPPDECSHAPGEKKIVLVADLAIRRSKDVCQADGPDGSLYCTDPVEVRPFRSQRGAMGFEIFLTRASERCDEKDTCTRSVHRKKGPVFAFDISNPRLTKILYVEPANIDLLKEPTDSEPTLDLGRNILSTLRVFQGGSRSVGVSVRPGNAGRRGVKHAMTS